ncbi:TPA: Cys-rich peptide radical SAM maturase CcpM [Clostridioides difficile]|nr:Cys-rich peptide radical SAM maturase CcpM [Clostridioides difficile]
MEQKPFIHLFQTSTGFYFYDVNTDSILNIDENVYDYLKKEQLGESSSNTLEYVEFLRKQGYLKSNKVKITEHPETEVLKYHCENRVEGIILQVTQNCNLHCDYCTYSGGYINRIHTNKRMSKETAKRGIDYLISHSRDCQYVSIGFYGGEPLLEFDLIKWCIEYSKANIEGKNLKYNLTTNATLITEEIIELFEENNVSIMISLDGPAEIHDKNRKFANNNVGSFSTIMKKLDMISTKYPNYFKNNVHFNSVLATDNFSCVNKFFTKEELFQNSLFLSSIVSEVNAKVKTEKSQSFYEESQYALFIGYLTLLGRIKKEDSSKLLQTQISTIGDTRNGKQGKQRLVMPEKWHHGGPCVPGVMRLFINVDGYFYPCEKASEASDNMNIGNLDQGYDLKKVEKLLNIERINGDKCHSCWAYENCRICAVSLSVDSTQEDIAKECEYIRSSIESDFQDYCVLKELGFDFETKELIENTI